MDEKDILLNTIEGLNASIASLSATNKKQAEQNENLQERIKDGSGRMAEPPAVMCLYTTSIPWQGPCLIVRPTICWSAFFSQAQP